MKDYVVTVLAQVPVRVPVKAQNREHAEARAIERCEEGIPLEMIQRGMADQRAGIKVVNVADHQEPLPPMELPLEYDAPSVR